MTYIVRHQNEETGSEWVDGNSLYLSLDEVAVKDATLKAWLGGESASKDGMVAVQVVDVESGEPVFFSRARQLNRAFRPF